MRGGEVGGFGEDGWEEVGGWWALWYGVRALFQSELSIQVGTMGLATRPEQRLVGNASYLHERVPLELGMCW